MLAHVCNDKPLGQSGTPCLLQADRLSDYQDIYDWKPKPNFAFICQTVFITLQFIGEKEYGKTGYSNIFNFLRHLKRDLFRDSILYHITNTDNTYGRASQI